MAHLARQLQLKLPKWIFKVSVRSEGCGNFYYFSTKAPRAYTEVEYPDECFLIFGKETKGLPEELLEKNLDRCVRIPMLENLRSLNLSNSAAIAVYEVLRQRGFEGLTEFGKYGE